MFRTKASTYAILALVEIAKRGTGRRVGAQAADIARSLHLPGAYAAKVLTQLARAGILQSDRGPRGGFRLARLPEAIDLLQVVEAVDGVIGAAVDVAGQPRAGGSAARVLDGVFDEVVQITRAGLRKQTLAGLLARVYVLSPA